VFLQEQLDRASSPTGAALVLLVASFLCLVAALLQPSEPWREAVGNAFLWSYAAWAMMAVVTLLFGGCQWLYRRLR
jgi:hypothetical protein